MKGRDRIVAEISRGWSGVPEDALKPLTSQSFEQVIKANAERGYILESWQFQAVAGPDMVREIIIAVFVANSSHDN